MERAGVTANDVLDPARRARITAWLDIQAPLLGHGPLEATPLSGGSSNDVFRITRGARVAVLRAPRLTDDRMIDREARVLAALAGSGIAHARLLGHCTDPAILGRHFIVSDLVEGVDGPQVMEQCETFGEQEAGELAFAVVDAAAGLSNLDYRAVGLEDFGKPEGFLARQVDRWLAMLASYAERRGHVARDIPELAFLGGWLGENMPPPGAPGLIHGDIGFSNAIFSPDRPRRVLAMLDWETATIGDPLLDLGRAVLPMRGEGRAHQPTRLHDYRKFPTREALGRAYEAATGRSVAHLDYYVVLAHFKLAVILERHHTTAVTRPDPQGQARMLADYGLELFSRAAAIARKQA
ncbi:MAG: hypothetical protein JWP35_3 [Caulobacter sp.]|nr:hypothetical protein [Caulobacter sp.]